MCVLNYEKTDQKIIEEAGNIIKSNFAGLVLFILALYILHQIHFSRGLMFIFFVENNIAEILFKNVIRRFLRVMREKGFNL